MTTQLNLPLHQQVTRSRHRTHTMRGPSLDARRTFRADLAERSLAILTWLKKNGPATARQIAEGLGFREMNAVRPRLTELCDAELVVVQGKRPDHITRINVYVFSTAV